MMKIKISQTYNQGYFDLTFDDETEIVEYYKDGAGECWHDVNIKLIETWAVEHGYNTTLDLSTFVQFKLKEGLAQDFISMVESKTTPTHTWVSMDDMFG
jgi:hypothetical protein